MARILISALAAAGGGAVSVSRGLSAALAAEAPDWDFEMLHADPGAVPPDPPPNLVPRLLPAARGLARRTLWEQLQAPGFARRRDVDVWLLLSGFVPFASRIPKLSVWQNAYLWSPAPEHLSPALRRRIAVQRPAMRWSVRDADLNVFLSRDSLDRCSERMTVPRERATVIPLGLDAFWLERGEPPGRESRTERLVMVGDLYVHKGFELGIRALALLSEARPALRLSIAGAVAVPEDARRLERLAFELGVADRVEFLGRQSREQLVALYESGLAYLAASSLETFGLTPLEAMACGLPVVATRRSATPEVCGDVAAYFDPHGAEALAGSIAALLASRDRWDRLREAGLARVGAFSWRTVAARYRDALETLVRSRTGGA